MIYSCFLCRCILWWKLRQTRDLHVQKQIKPLCFAYLNKKGVLLIYTGKVTGLFNTVTTSGFVKYKTYVIVIYVIYSLYWYSIIISLINLKLFLAVFILLQYDTTPFTVFILLIFVIAHKIYSINTLYTYYFNVVLYSTVQYCIFNYNTVYFMF